MTNDIADRLEIREIVENWVLWRDARRWDRFRTLWHPEGEMWATWFQGSYEEFITVSQAGYDRGVRIHHTLSGMSVDIAGERAIADTKVAIAQRADVDAVECDVTCWGRIYDFLEKRQGRWGIVLRRLIYEKDRIDPIDPSATLKLDRSLLARFPLGYRHLAYLQTRVGYTVKNDLPGLEGPALNALYAKGAAWLKGEPLG
jgi:SnoaL-like protein